MGGDDTGELVKDAGLVAGFLAGSVREHLAVIVWSVCVWLVYSTVIILRWTHRFGARRIAWFSVGAFTLALITLGALGYLHLGK